MSSLALLLAPWLVIFNANDTESKQLRFPLPFSPVAVMACPIEVGDWNAAKVRRAAYAQNLLSTAPRIRECAAERLR